MRKNRLQTYGPLPEAALPNKKKHQTLPRPGAPRPRHPPHLPVTADLLLQVGRLVLSDLRGQTVRGDGPSEPPVVGTSEAPGVEGSAVLLCGSHGPTENSGGTTSKYLNRFEG